MSDCLPELPDFELMVCCCGATRRDHRLGESQAGRNPRALGMLCCGAFDPCKCDKDEPGRVAVKRAGRVL